MKKRKGGYPRWFLWGDILLTTAALAGTASVIEETNRYLSFAGFGALFLLFLLAPYFLVLAAVFVLLMWSERSGRRGPAGAACALQMVSPLLWLWLAAKMEAPFSWFECIMAAQVAAGGVGLLLLLFPPRRPEEDDWSGGTPPNRKEDPWN